MEKNIKLIRHFAGMRQEMHVKRIENGVIHCLGGWDFCAITGAEIDEDLEWGPLPLMTGSYVVWEEV